MDAVSAIKVLVEQGFDKFYLSIVGYRGDNEYEDRLVNYIKKYKLEKYISVIDFNDNLLELRSKHDIGLICSVAEPFGRVTVENMLAGWLTIGTNSGGTPELIQNGVTGLLYEPGDIRGLVNILLAVYRNREEMKHIAAEGQEYAKKFFPIENTANAVYQVYRTICPK